MKGTHQILIGTLLIITISSCSIEKRVYTSGYHIEWNNFKDKNEILASNEVKKEEKSKAPAGLALKENSSIAAKQKVNDDYTSAIDRSIALPLKEKIKPPLKNIKTMMIAQNTDHNFIAQIKHQNVFNTDTKQKTAEPGKKSKYIAFLFCLFLGLLGAHRFYLGYNGLGAMYVSFTAITALLLIYGYTHIAYLIGAPFLIIGFPILILLCLLWLIDLLRILGEDLEPKDGEYE